MPRENLISRLSQKPLVFFGAIAAIIVAGRVLPQTISEPLALVGICVLAASTVRRDIQRNAGWDSARLLLYAIMVGIAAAIIASLASAPAVATGILYGVFAIMVVFLAIGMKTLHEISRSAKQGGGK